MRNKKRVNKFVIQKMIEYCNKIEIIIKIAEETINAD